MEFIEYWQMKIKKQKEREIMNELVIKSIKENITSLELLEEINRFRDEEAKGKNKKSKKLRHDTLLITIRDEFEEEISLQKIMESNYVNSRGKTYPMFVLTLDQARQILVRESKYVRKKVFEYIKYLENQNQMLRQALWNKQNSEWLQTRENGKLARRNETDAIATLILYAKEQGSKNADMMYITYSKLVNKLVGISTGMRESVDIEILMYIKKLEDLFTKIIIDSMGNKVYYKEIYKKCKRFGTEMMNFMRLDIKALSNKKVI